MNFIIQLQRVGVSRSLRGQFMPCEHEHAWFIEIDYWAVDGMYHAKLSYPNCYLCFPPTVDKPFEPEGDALTNESWKVYLASLNEHRMSIRSGQVAWTSSRGAQYLNPGAAMSAAREAIRQMLAVEFTFAPHIEAYMYYTPATVAGHPYLADDVYLTCALLTPDGDAIVHTDRLGPPLVTELNSSRPKHCSGAYLKQSALALAEYRKAHVQREPELERKLWLTWFVSELIKDMVPGAKPIVRKTLQLP